ncbi:MAG: GNAT family N-acetyltransferase [Lachnospiraceae bacterium]|nr:GNAT family N-acetyltransferase [Lachnospiraceae bacterium]MBD5503292.1 GNAT family N-acetyltransferase [Lachnospiraceae bacterium]
MTRLATYEDAEQLELLNDEFNGKGETSIENIRNSLLHNNQEFVVVEQIDDELAGFICVQLKKSFCYDEYMVEVTEVYVKEKYRRKGIAKNMIKFAEEYCIKNYPVQKIELLTGKKNVVAQIVYDRLGYKDDNEIHLSKRFKR